MKKILLFVGSLVSLIVISAIYRGFSFFDATILTLMVTVIWCAVGGSQVYFGKNENIIEGGKETLSGSITLGTITIATIFIAKILRISYTLAIKKGFISLDDFITLFFLVAVLVVILLATSKGTNEIVDFDMHGPLQFLIMLGLTVMQFATLSHPWLFEIVCAIGFVFAMAGVLIFVFLSCVQTASCLGKVVW